MAPSDDHTLFQYGIGVQGRGVTEEGLRRLKQPRGISLASDGALLVADFGSHCVLKFKEGDRRGKVVAGEDGKILPTVDILKDIDRPLGPAEGEGFLMKRPIDVCASEQGGLMVLDAEVCRLQHYGSPGEKAATVVPPPHCPPQKSVNTPEAIKYPRSMIVRPNGDVIICDTWSHRVLCFSQGASAPVVLAGKPNSSGSSPEQLSFPSGIAFDGQGRLYVADTNNHRVQRFELGETSGITVAGSAKGVPGTGIEELNMPTCLCIDSQDGSLLVTDRMNARVLRFHAGGGLQGEVVLGSNEELQRPWGICQDAQGAIYISDERKGVVLKVETPESLSSSTKPQAQQLFTPEATTISEEPAATDVCQTSQKSDHNALD